MSNKIVKHDVESSNISWISYVKEENKLYIGFKNGSIYEYYDVPEKVFDNFMKANSKGKFLWSDIRDKFKYKRLS